MTKRLYAKYDGSTIPKAVNFSTIDETNSTGRYTFALPNKHGRNFATWDARVNDPIEVWIDMDDRDDEIYASGFIRSVNGQVKPMIISLDGYKSKAKRIPLSEIEVDMTIDEGIVFDDVSPGDETLDVADKDGEKPGFEADQYNEAGVPRFLILSQTTDKDEEEKQATDYHITNMWHESGNESNTIARDNSNLLNRRNLITLGTNSWRLVLDMDIQTLNIGSDKQISYIDVDISAVFKINILLQQSVWETVNLYYSKDGSDLTYKFNSKSYTRGFYTSAIQAGIIRIPVGAGKETDFFDEVDNEWRGGALIFDVPDATLYIAGTDFLTLAIDYAKLIIGFTNDEYETLNLHIRDTIPVADINNTFFNINSIADYFDVEGPGYPGRDFTGYTIIVTSGDHIDTEYTITSNTATRFFVEEELTVADIDEDFTLYEKHDQLKFWRKHAGTIGEWPVNPPRVIDWGTNDDPLLDWITEDGMTFGVNWLDDFALIGSVGSASVGEGYHEFPSSQTVLDVEFWVELRDVDGTHIFQLEDNNNHIICGVRFNGADQKIDFVTATVDQDIQSWSVAWVHVRMESIYNGGECKLYINGKLISIGNTAATGYTFDKFVMTGQQDDGNFQMQIQHLGFNIYGYLPWDNCYLPYYFENGILEEDSWKIVKGIDEVFLAAEKGIALDVNRGEPILTGVDRDYTTLDANRLLTQLASNMAFQTFTNHDANSKPIIRTLSEDDLDPSYIEGIIISVNGNILEISNTAFYEIDFFKDWIIRGVTGNNVDTELVVASNDRRHITKFTMTTTPNANWVDDTVFLYNPKRTISKTLNTCKLMVQPIAENNAWGGVTVDYKNGTTGVIEAREGNTKQHPLKTSNEIEQIKLIRAKDIVTPGAAEAFGLRWANYYYEKHYSIDIEWTKFPDYIMHVGENWNYFILTNDGSSWTEVRYTNKICRSVSSNQDGSDGGWAIRASFGGGKTVVNDKLGHKLGDLKYNIDIEQSILPNIGEGGTVTRLSQISGLPSTWPPSTHNIQGSKHSGLLDHSVLDDDEPERHVLGTVSNELTGFPNRTDSIISMSVHDFRIYPTVTSFQFYSRNVLFSKSSTQLEDLSGYSKGELIYIWFDTSGVLQSSTTPWVFDVGRAFIATVYKDTTTTYKVSDERHGFMSGVTHKLLHKSFGMTHDYGLKLTAFDDGVINLTSGAAHDEDIIWEITGASPFQDLFLLHRDGSLDWVFNEETVIIIADGDIQYDNNGSLAAANIYVNYWVCISNFDRPIIVFMGQQTYSTKNSAYDEQFADLSLGTLPTEEIRPLYRVTYRKNGNMEAIADFRRTGGVPGGVPSVTSHLGLSDINGGTYGDGNHSNLITHIEQSGVPDADDDIDSFKFGAIWIDTDTNDLYMLSDNPDGAAVWKKLNYTDADAVAAVLADDAYVKNTGDNITGDITLDTGVDIQSADEDLYSTFGRAYIGYAGHGDWAGFGHRDKRTTSDFAIVQNSAGLTIVNASAEQSIRFGIGNVEKMRMDTSYLTLLAGMHIDSAIEDGYHYFGRSAIRSGDDFFGISHSDHIGLGIGALSQYKDGITIHGSVAGQYHRFDVGAVEKMRLDTTKLSMSVPIYSEDGNNIIQDITFSDNWSSYDKEAISGKQLYYKIHSIDDNIEGLRAVQHLQGTWTPAALAAASYKDRRGENIPGVDQWGESVGSQPTGWVIDSPGVPDCLIVADYNKHLFPVQILDKTGGQSTDMAKIISPVQSSGFIEFWFNSKDVSANATVFFRTNSGGTSAILMGIGYDTSGKLQYNDGVIKDIADIVIDKWYHIRIEFECGVGGAFGLAADTYNVWLNGDKVGSDLDFFDAVDSIDKFWFDTPGGDDALEIYVDSFGFSWEGYQQFSNYFIALDYPASPNIGDYYIIDTETEISGIQFKKWDWIVWNGLRWIHITTLQQELSIRVKATDSIQEILDIVVAAGGGTLYLMPGTHDDTTNSFPITIDSAYHVRITGEGELSVVDPSGDVSAFDIINGSSTIIENIKIDANDLTSTGTPIILITETSGNPVIIRNVFIDGDGTNGRGVDINSDNIIIKDCNFTDIRVCIYTTTDPLNNIYINNNIFNGNEYTGIQFRATGIGNRITENDCSNNGNFGILNLADYIIISGNMCNGNNVAGIWTEGMDFGIISNNQCNENDGGVASATGSGIYINNTTNSTISNNVCIGNDCNRSDSSAGGIYAFNSSGCVFSANVVMNNNNAGSGHSHGIKINTSDILIGNIVSGNDVNYETGINNFVLYDGVMDTSAGMSFKVDGSEILDWTSAGLRLGAANARVTTILDQDAMDDNSATALATQQSIKKYVDDQTTGALNLSGDLTITKATPMLKLDATTVNPTIRFQENGSNRVLLSYNIAANYLINKLYQVGDYWLWDFNGTEKMRLDTNELTLEAHIKTKNGYGFYAYSSGNDKIIRMFHNDTDGFIDVPSGDGDLLLQIAGTEKIRLNTNTLTGDVDIRLNNNHKVYVYDDDESHYIRLYENGVFGLIQSNGHAIIMNCNELAVKNVANDDYVNISANAFNESSQKLPDDPENWKELLPEFVKTELTTGKPGQIGINIGMVARLALQKVELLEKKIEDLEKIINKK